jgi:hypothetical protein
MFAIHQDCAILQYMKHNTLFTLFVLFGSLIWMSACKKGDNDPALSLRSRSARVVGDWKLHSGTYSFSQPFSADLNDTYTDSQVIRDSAGIKVYHAFTWDISFENDGTYTSVKKETAPGGVMETETVKGTWHFTLKNKIDDAKNKEGLILTTTDYALSSGAALSTYETVYPVFGEIWKLDRLSHHEFTIMIETTEDVPPGVRKTKAQFNFRSLKKSVVV